VAEKFGKKTLRPGLNDEPVELTDVVEEAAEEDYVLYGQQPPRARARRKSLIDLGALEDVAMAQAKRAVAQFLNENGADIVAAEAHEALAEVAHEVAPRVAAEVFREQAGEVLAAVAEEAALKAAREAFREVAADIIEKVARELIPKAAEEVIMREIEKIKASMRQGLS
jgi:uncharacterized membrane protein